jgi:hypothetical protein
MSAVHNFAMDGVKMLASLSVEGEALCHFVDEIIAPETLRQTVLLNLQQAQEHYLTRNKDENWS